MLRAHGDYILPDNVPAYEFMNLEGQKLSTSKNWAVWLPDYLEEFEPDPLRYYLALSAPENQDSDFKWHEFQNFNNSHMADVFGNFVNRVVSMTRRYFDGNTPALGETTPEDQKILDLLKTQPKTIGNLHEQFRLRDATTATLELARAGNLYLQEQQPWKLAKTDMDRCGTVLNVGLEICRALAILFHPVIPFTCAKIWRMLNLAGTVEDQQWDNAGQCVLETGHPLGDPEILFTKIEDDIIQKQLDKLKSSDETVPEEDDSKIAPLLEDLVSWDEVAKLDLRVADVIEAERVKKTDKLLKLRIRLGSEERTIIAGVAQFYTPEQMVGKQIVVVANLEPAKIRGIESRGMLLAANDGECLTVVGPAEPCKSRSRVL